MNNVRIQNKTDTLECDHIIHILVSLFEEYDVTVSLVEGKLMHFKVDLDIEEVRDRIVLKYNQPKQHDNNNNKDSAFAAFMNQYKSNMLPVVDMGTRRGDQQPPETQKNKNN